MEPEAQTQSGAPAAWTRAELERAQRIAQVGSWTWQVETDTPGTWTLEMYRITGRDPQAAPPLLSEFIEIVHPDDRERLTEELRDRQEFAAEFRIVRPDGEIRTVHVVGRPDPTRPGIHTGTLQDITELRRAEQALHDSEQFLSNVFDNAPIGMAVVATDGRWLRVNDAFCRIVGYSRETLLGLTFQDITHPSDLEADLALTRQLIKGVRDSFSMEKRYVRADGEAVWVNLSVSLVRDAEGKPDYLVAQVQDITEAKTIAQTLCRATTRTRAILDHAPMNVVLRDIEGRIEMINSSAAAALGSTPDELVGVNVSEAFSPDRNTRLNIEKADQELIRTGRTKVLEVPWELPDGTEQNLMIMRFPVFDDAGQVVSLGSIGIDVTERRRNMQELGKLAAIVESSHDAIISETLDGTITSWNPGAERMFGYSTAEAIGRSATLMMAGPNERRDLKETLRRVGAGEVVERPSTRRRTKDGRILDVSVVVSPVRDDDGKVIGAAAIYRDISGERRTAAELAEAQARFQTAFENAPIGVALAALRGPLASRFIQTNPALNRMLGMEPGELNGVSFDTITHPDDTAQTAAAFGQTRHGGLSQIEKRCLHRDGREIWVLISAMPIPEADGSPSTYAVAHILDISERKRFETQLVHLADHDTLTGLYNRHRFEQELGRVVEESRRYRREVSLLMLDVDAFKSVNDRFGHRAGDELVRRIAQLMRACLRDTDILARIGGDEFGVILNECGPTGAVRTAEKILEAIRRRGIMINERHRAKVTTSIGITSFDGETNLSAADLIVEADVAMYAAKADGKDRQHLYNRAAGHREARSTWLERLRRAIDEDLFVLHAQPIVGFRRQEVPCYELLLRLPDEQGGLIPPGVFLSSAERFDLMGEIDRWVLRQAVQTLHRCQRAGHRLSLAVNLSGRTMNDAELADDLAEVLAAYPIEAGSLIVEVTETAAIVNIERARDLALELRALGCRFALDDFGAGFASFYYLKHLEFDYLKIDGEFIRNLTDTPADQLVVKAVVEIADGLGTETIAEYVGDDTTVALLRELGVGYGQGFHLGRPAPLAEMLPLRATTA